MRPLPRRSTKFIVLVTLAIVALFCGVLWLNRWRLGHTAVTIADPLVRAWAAEQAIAMSDGAYHFDASPLKVNEANHSLAIDSITLTTDSAINSRLAEPHPDITVRFRHCAVTGIDLTALAARRGLHALRAGCDSVLLAVRTLVAPDSLVTRVSAGADSNNFLRFQGKLDLPDRLPFVAVDSIAFPSVQTSFDLLASDGRRTSLAVDSIAVALDSLRIDPRQKVASRRPLFSRNIRIRLDRFVGSTKAGELLSLEHFSANLENGTARFDAIGYERPAGAKIDSTGSVELRAKHIALDGVHWRTFLLTGDIEVGELQIDSALVHMVGPRNPRKYPVQALAGSIAHVLRSAGRGISIGLVGVHAVRSVEIGRRIADTAITTLRQLTMAHLDVSAADSAWQKPYPIGHVVLKASDLTRHRPNIDLTLGQLVVDAGAKSLVIDSLRAAPRGDDSAFNLRNRYREARLSVNVPHLEAQGIDVPAFLMHGALRARLMDVPGFSADIMEDGHKAEDPKGKKNRRSPQGVLRDGNTEIQLDTLSATGIVTYRARDEDAAKPGVLTFKAIQLRGYNFSTDPARMSDQTPFRLVADARLMGAGAMHVEWNVPLLSREFTMNWKGSLGTMDPKAMNAFLPDAVGMRFIDGVFDQAEWSVRVRSGVAQGTLAPRWHGLKVELPGVARKKTGIFGGMLRGVAKLATNTFGIRGDNSTVGGHVAMDGKIIHPWIVTESLPEFIWNQLRDPLLSVLKR